MACKLSENQIIALAKYVTSSLENAKPESLDSNFAMNLMKNLYDSIVSKTGDAVNALDYIQHIPTSILAVSGANPEYFSKLVTGGVDINKLTLMMKEFEDVDNVKKAMTGNVKLEEIKNEIINNELPDSGVIPTDTYSEIEKKDAELKKSNQSEFKAKPETGFATFMQEAKTYDGNKQEDNIPDNDPLKVLHFRVVRMLNTLLSEKNLTTADNLKLDNVKGVYYKLVDFNEIPEDNVYLEHKKYHESNPTADKGVALVLSDKDGNVLYFDNEGNISSKEDGGKLLYTSMRRADSGYIYNVQKTTEIAKKTGKELAEVEKTRKFEIDILNKARDYAKNPNNASNPLLFSITQGSNGYILEDYSKPIQLSNLNFPTGFAPFISTDDVGMMIKGGVYFQPDSGKNFPVLLRRPNFENIKGLTEGLIEVLYDDKITNAQKIALVKQFVFSNNTAIYEEAGKLFVKQKGEAFEIDNSTKAETAKKIAANLNSQIVNINADLLNRTVSIPVVEAGKLFLSEMSYNKFLATNFYTYLQPNSEKNIVSLNAYNVIKPTQQVLDTLTKEETQSTAVEPKGEKVKEGIYVNQAALSKEEQLELFNYLKPFLESQGKKTNKGANAPIMIGLGLRWDYKSNNPNRTPVNVGVNLAGGQTSYAYYDLSINGKPLGKITTRFVELMNKTTGVDISNYDGAIINIYSNGSFIGNHSDLEESATAEKYPVVVANIGGSGNIILGTGKDQTKVDLKAGAGYLFGFEGKNRKIAHSTYASDVKGFLPSITISQEGKTFNEGGYRVSITMRRVMPLAQNMPQAPSIVSPTQVSVSATNNPAEYTNHSGGAYGGDTFWDIIGREFGVTNHMHYKDAGNTNLSEKLRNAGVKATVLTKEQMDTARTEVERLLGEKYPDTLQGNLQVRNYYQVANADAVYAVAEITQVVDKNAPKNTTDITKSVNSYKHVVKGGTNTAVQLGIKLGKPVYVWDLATQSWYKWDENRWFEKTDTPVLTKNFAGVGSRDIESYNVQKEGKWVPREQYKGKEVEEAAKQAIRDVYINTFKTTTQPTVTKLETAVDTNKSVNKENIFEALNALKRNTLNRSNTLVNNDVTEAQMAAAKDWYDNSPLAKIVPYEVMFNIVNSDAWADFTAAGIRLYAGSTYADLYHEGWHAFSQLFLTVDQKKNLYDEVGNTQPSLKNATDSQIEEHLAEDFRKYALAKGENIKSNSPVRNTLFRKIWNFLKSLFTGHTVSDVLTDMESIPAVKELYEKLYVGNLNEYRPSINNMMFTGLNLGVTANSNDAEQVLNYNDSLVVSDSIDSIMSDILQDERNLGGVSLIFENEAAKNYLYLAVKNEFKQIINSIQEKIAGQPEEAVQKELNDIRILQTAVDNWDGVLKFHKKKSVLLDFKQKVSDQIAVDIDSNKDEEAQKTTDSELEKSEAQLQEEYGKNVFESKGNERSTREIATAETMYLIGSLHAYDRNGKRIQNRFGVDKLADPNKTWGIVLNAIEGAVDDQEMYSKLLAASKVHPELKELANLLGDPSEQVTSDSAGKVKLWTKFYRDFSLSRIPIYNLKADVNIEGEIKFQEIQPNFSAVNKVMLDNYGAINNNYTNSNNKDGIHRTDVVKVLKDFKDITSREEAYDFLKAIGIELTNNQAVKERLGYVLSEVKEIRGEFEKLKALIDKGAKPLEVIYRNVPKSVITVLNIEAQYSGRFNNNARYNVNNDIVYDLSLNNTISKLFKEFNNIRKNYQQIVSQPHMRHLDVRINPNAKYSIWLHSLFNLDETDLTSFTQRKNIATYGKEIKNTIGLINIDGIKDETLGYGIKTTNLDPASKFIMDMHMLLISGVQELMRHGDKSSAYGVKLGKLFTKFNDSKKTSHLFIDPNYFNTEAGHNAAVELILPKIAAELERIAILKEGGMPIIPGFNDSPTARGFSLTMFDSMLSEKTKTALIALANPTDSLSVITTELKQNIANELKSYFEGIIKENTDLYNEYDVMDSKVKSMIKVAPGSSKTTEQIAIEAYTYNAMLYNMESIAMLYGDLALYNHAKDEFHKRNSSIGSTGRDFRASESFYAFMATKNRLYAKSLGVADSKYQFNGILNTAVFQDSNVSMPSEMFDEYVKAYIESSKLNGRTVTKEQAEKALAGNKKIAGYKKINEGDGQGWVTFDSYRLLKLAEGDWSDAQENLYNKIVNNEEVTEADALEFFPPYKVQYSGPLQSNKLHIQAFHKFSLAPLIPSVIKGTNMEILHNNMVRQNLDYGLFESGSKLASYTKDGKYDTLYTGKRKVKEWVEGEPEYTKNPIFIQYLKNQVDIAPTFKGNSIFSTQLRKLIINDIFKNGVAVNPKMGGLVAKFEALLDELQESKTKDLLKEIGWESLSDANDTAKLSKLLKFVKKELTRQDLADNIIDFLDINPDGSIKYDLSLSLHADKIEKLMNAIVIKRLVKQKFNGEGLIQLASTGFENATSEQNNKYGASDLPTYYPGKNGLTTAMKVKIALQGNFKKLLNLSDVKKLSEKENITPLQALNTLIKDEAWMAKNKNLVTMVGVRIPVQGLNSMEFMEVYEFLPEEASNAIIVPSELVTKSGGDFDIDKLTIFMPNISTDEKTSKPYFANGKNTKGVENRIIENIREILEQPESFASLVTPNDTNLVNNEIVEELAKLNIHGYSGKIPGEKGISPTRVLEQRFNYAKMEENNIGKKMLGIGAVDNSYSSIFKRIGAHMGSKYTFYRVDKKGNITPQERNIRMLLEHNTMTVDGKKVISLSDIETKTGVKVSDLISQLMNGWVDVAKDAWVFNINGNNIAGPVLLFMLEAGVDYETAVYLCTQPLVVEYVKEVYKQMSPFNKQDSETPIKITMGLAKYKAKVEMLKRFGHFLDSEHLTKNFTKISINPKSTDLYKKIVSLAGTKEFKLEDLKNAVVNKDKSSDFALSAFAHFLELEETAKTLTNAKLKVNVDTTPSKSIVAANKRLLDIAELENYEAMPLVNKIFTDSPIKSFLIQGLQIKLFSPLMPLRFNDVVTTNIIHFIKDGNLIRNSFNGDIEKFSDAYKNDLVTYIFQNVVKGINFKTLKEYKGLNIKPLSVKNVMLKAGAFVKDGNLYIDLDQLKHDFDTNAFAGQGEDSSYKELGLHTLPAVYFKSIGNKDQQFQEYVKFVIEREILRSITKGSEEDLAKRALERSFNFYHNYKSKDSIANQLFELKEAYADSFVADYSAFFDNILNKKKTKGDFQQLGLRTNKVDSNLANAIVESLIRLADPSTKKVSNPAENNRISRFFNRLIVSEVLRSGLSKTSTSIISVIPNEVIANILSSYTKDFVNLLNSNPNIIDKYNSLFAINAGSEFKNYVNSNSIAPTYKKIDGNLSEVPNSDLLVLTNYKDLKATLDGNQDKVFLFANNINNITESKETGVFQKAENSLPIPLKQKGGTTKSALWTDATYEDNIKAISNMLDVVDEQKQNGTTIVIPSNGLHMVDGVNILANAPKTYEYLVGELYKRFNFVTPGAEQNFGFRTIVQENQEITDTEVNEILNKKFEESKKCNQ